MHIHIARFRVYPAAVLLMSFVGSLFSPLQAQMAEPVTQKFLVTAYYSPLPDQCCYFRGNYEDEIIFNGNGTHGADGTPVYPGMVAAPAGYAFGTRIDLPGVGVMTVHDRGGRIIEWDNGVVRIDIWMGYGEEGLARALAWGARPVTGTVFAPGTAQPKERFALADFEAPIAELKAMPQDEPSLLLAQSSIDDRKNAVRLLQQSLKDAGFFHRNPTGTYGAETTAAVKAFQETYGIPGDGSEANDATRAALMALASVNGKSLAALPALAKGANGNDVRTVQKLMRYLGFYRGRTNGVYDDTLAQAVLAFQIAHGVIGNAGTAGATNFGPKTKLAALQVWKKKQVAERSKSYLLKIEITRRIEEELSITRTITMGDQGKDITAVQRLLARLGLLGHSDVSGYFGQKTEQAVIKYQLSREIIPSETANSAGNIGPATRAALKADAIESAYNLVRSSGLSAL